jgi:single-strand DNA-binding protein
MNLNKAELIGNLVGDPAAKKLPSGKSVVRFRLATTWKNGKTEASRLLTEYHEIIAFGKLADVAAKYLKKGDKVYVDGRLTNRSWQDKAGGKNSRSEIVMNNLIMLGGNKKKAEPEKTNDDVIVEEIPMYQNPPDDFHD